MAVFPKYFRSRTEALQYANQPEKIANKVYGGRLGNTEPGDGWKFRGAGMLQITGRENFTKLAKATGIDCVNNPDLLLEEANSMVAAIWFWTTRKLQEETSVAVVTKKIQGGSLGLDNRQKLYDKWLGVV